MRSTVRAAPFLALVCAQQFHRLYNGHRHHSELRYIYIYVYMYRFLSIQARLIPCQPILPAQIRVTGVVQPALKGAAYCISATVREGWGVFNSPSPWNNVSQGGRMFRDTWFMFLSARKTTTLMAAPYFSGRHFKPASMMIPTTYPRVGEERLACQQTAPMKMELSDVAFFSS